MPRRPNGYQQPVSDAVSTRILKERRARRWSRQGLSDAIADAGYDLPYMTIYKIEAANRPVRVDEAVAIAAALDLSISDLLGEVTK